MPNHQGHPVYLATAYNNDLRVDCVPSVAAGHVRVDDVHLPLVLGRHRDVVVDVARHFLNVAMLRFQTTKLNLYHFVMGVYSLRHPKNKIFCIVFLTCYANRWSDTAATVQPHW